ncbi:MAG: YitT family protein [Ruthenibacterium sp.]
MKLTREKLEKLALDLLYDISGSILFALGIYTFAKSAAFAPGGVSGLALVINYISGLPIGVMSLLLNVPIILISYKVVGKAFLFKSLRTMIISTFFMDVVFPHIPLYTGDRFLAALFTGLFVGAGLAIIYVRGSSTGGADFLIIALNKLFPHLSVGTITLFTDGVVILLGGLVFGDIDAMLYGAVSTVVSSIVMDKIMYGNDGGKMMIIISNYATDIAKQIDALAERGSTLVHAVGTYSGEERLMLYCVCSKRQAFRIKNAAHDIDPLAFMILTDATEVYGEGFLEKET